jgi:hypothetical protein
MEKLTFVAVLPLDPKQQGRSSKLTDVENSDYKDTHTYKAIITWKAPLLNVCKEIGKEKRPNVAADWTDDRP